MRKAERISSQRRPQKSKSVEFGLTVSKPSNLLKLVRIIRIFHVLSIELHLLDVSGGVELLRVVRGSEEERESWAKKPKRDEEIRFHFEIEEPEEVEIYSRFVRPQEKPCRTVPS